MKWIRRATWFFTIMLVLTSGLFVLSMYSECNIGDGPGSMIMMFGTNLCVDWVYGTRVVQPSANVARQRVSGSIREWSWIVWEWPYVRFKDDAVWLVIPIWAIVATCALADVVVVVYGLYRRRAARRRPDCACGYKLTGNVSGTCPECGAEVPEDLVQREEERGRESTVGPHDKQTEPES